MDTYIIKYKQIIFPLPKSYLGFNNFHATNSCATSCGVYDAWWVIIVIVPKLLIWWSIILNVLLLLWDVNMELIVGSNIETGSNT